MGGVDIGVLEETHRIHCEAAKNTEKDPDGGSWPAYPSGKSWDEPSGKTGSGNSTKATSGINGAETKTQKNKGIEDSIQLFTNDTLKGGAKRPEGGKVLCGNSGADVDWLVEKFDLDLSLVARLGGHSAPRTHRGKERFPGMTITYALIQMLEKVAERTDRARIITKACANKLLMEGGNCVGLVFAKAGVEEKMFGPVILTCGGFGADFTS